MVEFLGFIVCLIVVALLIRAKRKNKPNSQSRTKPSGRQNNVETTPLRKELKQKSVALNIIRKSNGRGLTDDQNRFVERTKRSIEEIESALGNDSRRSANDKSGFVYVITNPSFRADIVKIGMTCQINPMSRVDDLYNTSTPLRFEPEIILYSENALYTEQQLHEIFKSRRVNSSREFFSATSEEVHAKARRLKCDILFIKSTETPVLRY